MGSGIPVFLDPSSGFVEPVSLAPAVGFSGIFEKAGSERFDFRCQRRFSPDKLAGLAYRG